MREEDDPMKKPTNQESRKPYQKPVLLRFPLRPEEAVLGFCKSTTAPGPSGGNCMSLSCMTQGS